jgi:hypothetical protein
MTRGTVKLLLYAPNPVEKSIAVDAVNGSNRTLLKILNASQLNRI